MSPQDSDNDQTLTRGPAADPTAARPAAADSTAARPAARPSADQTAARPSAADATRTRSRELPADVPPSFPTPDFPSTAFPAADGTLMRPPGTVAPAYPTPPAPIPQHQAPRQQVPFGQGYRLRGRYLLDELIGQGAMGQVWRAKDLLGEEARDRNPYVAVKVLNSDFESRPDAFIALHREAARAQKLAHPNIVTVYVFDRDEESGRAFIAMELLEGRPLDRLIRQSGPGGLSREQSLPIIRGMAEGLAYAHRKGIVHSDFKPANVFLTADGTPKILDFGIARAVQVAERAGGALPGLAGAAPADNDDSGFQGYTVNYAAPEALAGAQPSTTEDVFALGIVAYELVSGAHPFKRMSVVEARAAHVERPPLKGLKRREARAIDKALAYEPAQRYPDAAAFLRQFQGIPLIQKALIAAVAVLVLAAAGLSYRNYLNSLPDQPLESLPMDVQRDFHEQVRQGNEALAALAAPGGQQLIAASADAADYFGKAYAIHPKDPLAERGLEQAADYAIEWFLKRPDRQMAREQLERFSDKSVYYKQYPPMQKALRELRGE